MKRSSFKLMIVLAPLLAAFAFLSAAFATAGAGDWAYWLFAPTVLLAPTWVLTLVYLASTSETNTAGEHTASLPLPTAKRATDREAA